MAPPNLWETGMLNCIHLTLIYILSEGAFSGTNQTVCQLEENTDESENLCQDKSRAKGLKMFQSF